MTEVVKFLHQLSFRIWVCYDDIFRMLVRRFPELAEKVFDACITQKEKDVMEFDFQFLDDTYTLERVEKDEKVKSS